MELKTFKQHIKSQVIWKYHCSFCSCLILLMSSFNFRLFFFFLLQWNSALLSWICAVLQVSLITVCSLIGILIWNHFISHSSDLEFFQEKFSCMARLVYSETLKEIDLCGNKWIIFINWHLIVQRIWKNLSYICFLYSVLYLLKVCIYFSIYLLFSSKITIV